MAGNSMAANALSSQMRLHAQQMADSAADQAVEKAFLAAAASAAPGRFIDRALDAYRRWAARKRYDERVVIVKLSGTITTSTTNYQQSDTYQVPADEALFIFAIKGLLGLNAPTAETLTITGLGNPDVRSRIALKAMNCRISLKDQDEPRDIVADAESLVLADILPGSGGDLFVFPEPDLVPPGHVIKATMALTDTTASVVGGSTDYGLYLIGKQVRIEDR